MHQGDLLFISIFDAVTKTPKRCEGINWEERAIMKFEKGSR